MPIKKAVMLVLLVSTFAPGVGASAKDLGDLLVERGIIRKEDLEQLRRDAQQGAPGATAAPVAEPSPGSVGIAPAAPVVTGASAAAAPPPSAASEGLDALVKREVQSQLPDWLQRFKISTLLYMDWAYYFNTGYGPQLLTQITPPGPGNDGFNSFDLTRAYINLFWKPSDRFLIRVTPNVFREVDTSATVNTSKSSQVATNVNGNLSYRLKYGFLQINNVFQDLNGLRDTPVLKDMNVKIGQIENPLIPWEEDMYGYRFVNLVPLNFLAYSSTDLGIAAMGPVTVGGVRYADYWVGYYNGSSFHAAEFNEFRSPQGRVSAYPFAALPGFENLGVTYFMSYGYSNVAPDTPDALIRRIAALAHYAGRYGGLAFEYDRTRNENGFGNFFSGAAPTQSIPDPNTPGHTIPNPITQLYTGILDPSAIGEGYDVFGHLNLWDWPFSVFGMWQRWYPNLDVNSDPLDFDRLVAGVSWQAQRWMRVALDSQNIMYVHSGSTVPQDTHALFTNLEINY